MNASPEAKIVAYINGLGIGVSSSDTVLIRRMKKFGTNWLDKVYFLDIHN